MNGLPLHFQLKHSIEIFPGSSLPNAYVYKISILENKYIHRQIQDLINKGHIFPNSSPCGSLVVLVPNKYGTWCMCIYYRALNKILVKKIYPLPRINELIECMNGANFFTNIDLRSRYHQIPIDSIDVWKMNSNTKEGLLNGHSCL